MGGRLPRGEFRKVPNWFTGLRLLIVPFGWVCALLGLGGAVGVGLIVAGLSDAVDGFLARKLNQTSAFGSKLDSIADTLIIRSVVVWVLLLRPEILLDHLIIVPLQLLLDLAVLAVGWAKFRQIGNLHLYGSKAAGIVQYVFIVHAFLFGGYSTPLLYAAFTLAILAGLEQLIVLLTRDRVDEHIGSVLVRGVRG